MTLVLSSITLWTLSTILMTLSFGRYQAKKSALLKKQQGKLTPRSPLERLERNCKKHSVVLLLLSLVVVMTLALNWALDLP